MTCKSKKKFVRVEISLVSERPFDRAPFLGTLTRSFLLNHRYSPPTCISLFENKYQPTKEKKRDVGLIASTNEYPVCNLHFGQFYPACSFSFPPRDNSSRFDLKLSVKKANEHTRNSSHVPHVYSLIEWSSREGPILRKIFNKIKFYAIKFS